MRQNRCQPLKREQFSSSPVWVSTMTYKDRALESVSEATSTSPRCASLVRRSPGLSSCELHLQSHPIPRRTASWYLTLHPGRCCCPVAGIYCAFSLVYLLRSRLTHLARPRHDLTLVAPRILCPSIACPMTCRHDDRDTRVPILECVHPPYPKAMLPKRRIANRCRPAHDSEAVHEDRVPHLHRARAQ